MIIATVTAISGQAWARDAAGNLRELRIGDTLQEGEVLVTAEGGRVELDVGGGAAPTVIQGGQEVAMSPELDADAPVTEEEASALDEDLETLLTAIDEGEGDLLVDLDAPAAGAGPGGSAEGGHSFVRLARIVEPLTPLSYEYGLGQFDEVEFPEDQFLAQAAEEEDATPTVGTADLDGDGDTVWESALTEGSGGGVATTGGDFQIDTGSDELALVEVQDAAGNWVAISVGATEVQGIYGVLSVNPDGSWTYTLTEPLAHPLAGETGTSDQLPAETFAVRVTDDDGDVSAPATLTITITDDGPTAVQDGALVAEDTTTVLTGDVLANDTLGADRPEGVAFDDTQASYGTFTDNGDGTWSYVLDNDSSAVQSLSEGETLTETFAYTLTDADGDTSTATLTVTITGQDDGVTLTGITVGSAEQTVYEANLPAGSDTDAASLIQSGVFSFTALDELGSLTIAGESLTLAELQALSATSSLTITSDHGTLLLTGFSGDAAGGTLSYTYTLDATVDNATVTGATGTEYLDSFAVSLVDTDGSSASASLDIRIVDDTPSAVDDPDASITEDTTTTLTGDVLFNDTLGADRPEGVAFDDTQASYATFTDNGDGTWSYVLDNDSSAVQGLSVGETLTETFDYTLTDADGDTSTATLTVTITGQDDGVTLTGISVGSAEQTVYEANLPAGSDTDVAALTQSGTFSFTAFDELGSLTIAGEELSLVELQALSADSPLEITSDHGTLLLTGFSGDATGGMLSYTYTLDATVDNATVSGATGTEYLDSFAVSLVDADGSSASASLDIRIDDDAPSLDTTNLAIANIAGSYEGTFELIPGADTQDFADQVSLQWLNAAEGYSLVYDAESSTADLQVFNGVYNEGEDTFFTLAVSADGTYTFGLVQPAPVLEVPVESLLAGVTGGSNLPQYVFDDTLFGGYFEVVVTGSNDDGDGTLTISATELGVNDNVVHGDKGDVLTFDVVPVSGFENVTLSELTFEIAGTAGAKPGDMVELRIVYDGEGGETVYSEAIGDDYSITVSTDPALTVDFIELAPADKVSLKIEGLSAEYAILEYPDDYQLDFALTGTDADGDEAVSDFSVLVNTTDSDSYVITGTVESDTLYGTEGDDTLAGGAGDDTLSGDAGADTFDWNLSDEGDAESPSLDTVTDFSVGEGDMLDISDMLSGMPDGADLSSFIQAAPSDSGTMLYISTEGSLADGDLSGADQMILLSNVEMGDLSSLQFLQSLIEEGQLEID
ncbi:retention module-containing protein [Halomonas alimentaria]|uniref:retention module-containing protein n=1 Tax=Halomonas alimentaria TaxID=147248 RepID=UPI00248FD916|nr:retention module-containing protein [Halomonas alimentaria]